MCAISWDCAGYQAQDRAKHYSESCESVIVMVTFDTWLYNRRVSCSSIKVENREVYETTKGDDVRRKWKTVKHTC